MTTKQHPNGTLASPFTLQNGHSIKNRIMKSATSEQLGDKNHNPTKELAKVYQTWSEGDIGLIVTGNIMIDRTALGEPRNVVLDDNSDLAKFSQWAKSATVNGNHCWAQLNHPGRQSPIFLSSKPVAPSVVAMDMGKFSKAFAKPRALSNQEVWDLVEKFATSAKLAKSVGFTGVQIHSAHGYLINQFLSPSLNIRTDEWGGDEQKRMKFLIEVYKAIRAEVGDDFPVGVKLNSADFQKEGFSEEASMEVVKTLTELGIDHVEISGGSYESQAFMGDDNSLNNAPISEHDRKREAYFLTYAEKLRTVSNVPLTVTGGFRSARGMQEAIDEGATDFIGLARPLLIYPDCAKKIISDINYTADFKYPTTKIKFVDEGAMLNITWYEEQIHLMGKGKKPDPNLNAWLAVAKMYGRMGRKAFAKRRA